MNRAILIVWMVLLTLSAYGLFSIKYHVYDLKRDVAEVNRQLTNEKSEIHVLKAEWTYLTNPERLRVLASKYLGLEPISVAQIQPLEYQGVMVALADGTTKLALDESSNDDKIASVAVTGKNALPQVAYYPILKPLHTPKQVRQ